MTHYLISEASRELSVEAHVLRYWEEELKLEIPRNELGHRYYTEKQLALFRRIKELKELGYQLKAIKTSLNEEHGLEEGADEAGFLLQDIRPDETEEPDVKTQDTESGNPAETGKRFQVLEGREAEKSGRLDYLTERLSANASGPMTEAVLEKMKGKSAGSMSQGEDDREKSAKDSEEQKDKHVLKTDGVEGAGPEAEDNRGGKTALEMVRNGGLDASPEKLEQFQTIMTDVLAEALRRNQDILSKEVGGTVSEKLVKEINYLMRDREEREEERYRKLDETIRTCQRVQRQKSEAAATRVPVRSMKKSRFPWGRRRES